MRWFGVLAVSAVMVSPVFAQRTVTLTLNSASIPDTIRTDTRVDVRGTVDGNTPNTLPDGNVIDWGDKLDTQTTLIATNIGGDYWQVSFEADSLQQFKFYSQQAEEAGVNGWEADPNPKLDPGTNDTTLVTHFFRSQSEWMGWSGNDEGREYDWRPYEHKPDSVAVWYRVYMGGPETDEDGYDPDDPNQGVAVTGASIYEGSPMNWENAVQMLMQESTNRNTAAYDLYSYVVYYPMSAVGSTQSYKFVLTDPTDPGASGVGVIAWEEGNVPPENRTFVVPEQDTTLQWVYYGNTPPSKLEPVTGDVIFTVDLSPLVDIGFFSKARGDTLQVVGSHNQWDWQDRVEVKGLLDPIPGTVEYENVTTLTQVAPRDNSYKYVIIADSAAFHDDLGYPPPVNGDDPPFPITWEEPLSKQGGNRSFQFTGAPSLELPVDRFNDILPANVIPEGNTIELIWTVDMGPAENPPAGASNLSNPFVPGTDKVSIELMGDPVWAAMQGVPRRDNAQFYTADTTATVNQVSGKAGVYEIRKTINGPGYSSVQYKYWYGTSQSDGLSEADGSYEGGRRRTRFIHPNPDGSWPATWTFPAETFLMDGDKPFEQNPATGVAIEEVGGELPTQVSLHQNYPNPFNPTTTVEYSVDRKVQVTLHVYDVVGRRVATLVDGIQSPSTYRVTFDARDFASGTYFYRLEANGQVITKSMVLLK
jgi:hypothetical protein